MKPGRRGVALMVVLAMLALLAVAFAGQAGLDRQVSRNHLDALRALFIFGVPRGWSGDV
jgi:Tfp pilus assembly protein PilX